MSEDALSTAVYAPFGGRDCKFELRLGEIRELERICKAGIAAIYLRVSMLQFAIDDIRETIRLGLIGGGLAPAEAQATILFSVDGRPINESTQLAADILKACFEGVMPGNQDRAESNVAPATSPDFMKSGEPWDSARETSTN